MRVGRGRLVLLDVHGTDHDPTLWPDPDAFDPGRFLGRTVDPFSFVPQGGGDVRTGHRCPGEPATVALLEVLVRRLAPLDLELPDQDLSWSLDRMPARPRSGVRVRLAPSAR